MQLALAQCFVGLNITIGKFLIGFFPIFFLLTARFFIGLVGILIFAYMQKFTIKKILENFILLARKDKYLFFLQAMCGGLLFNILILYGMKMTTAVSAGIINSITPVVILILSVFLLREKINSQKIYAVLMVAAGLAVLAFGKGSVVFEKMFLGNLLLLLAVFPEAFFTILSKFTAKKLSETEGVVLVNFFNLLIFLPFALFGIKIDSFRNIEPSVYGQLLIYGLSGGVLFFLLWYRGLTKVSVHTAALFTAFMPMSTAILAVLFLNEPIHGADILGILLIMLAIFIGCRVSPQTDKSHLRTAASVVTIKD